MTILPLMKRRWTAAEEVERLTTRLVRAQRASREAADALFDAQTREANRLLVLLMRAEHPPKSKGKQRLK